MDLPSILPIELKNLIKASNDHELFEQLLNSTENLTQFFSYASDDETWSSCHESFFHLALNWFTRQYIRDRLKNEHIKVIVSAFQEHYTTLKSLLPRPLEIKTGANAFFVNPFLLGYHSPYFRSLIRKEKNVSQLKILEIPQDLAEFGFYYLESLDSQKLWKFEQTKIQKMLDISEQWGVLNLAQECQEVLKRYIQQDHVSEVLVQSFKKERWIMVEKAVDLFNEKFIDGRILNQSSDRFVFEFINFGERALMAFDAVKTLITHLVFKGNLTIDEKFLEVIHKAPKLIGLVLSETNEWSPFFSNIPDRIYDVDIAECAWLKDQELRSFLRLIPRVSILSLAGNTQLTYRGLSEIKNLHRLKSLNLSRCSQMGNDELNLILQGNTGLIDLNLYGCRKLSDESFYEIGRRSFRLQKLNLSRTNINDGALIDICLKCNDLIELSLNHCLNITESGLLDAIRLAKQLKKLSIQENHLDSKVLLDLNLENPNLIIQST